MVNYIITYVEIPCKTVVSGGCFMLGGRFFFLDVQSAIMVTSFDGLELCHGAKLPGSILDPRRARRKTDGGGSWSQLDSYQLSFPTT